MRLAAGVVATLACCIQPGVATAASWRQPVVVGDQGLLGPGVRVSRSGDVRVIEGGSDRHGEVVVLRHGGGRSRCAAPLPGTFDSVAWDANRSGAMALGWGFGEGRGRWAVTTAQRGACFGSTQVVSPADHDADLGSVGIGGRGTAVALWRERMEAGSRVAYASGTAGSPLVRRGTLRAESGEDTVAYLPTFAREDRVMWTWWTRRTVGRDPFRQRVRLWFATTARRAGALGRPLKLVDRTEGGSAQPKLPSSAAILTAADRSQVAGWKADNQIHIRARKAGGRFGRTRSFDAPTGEDSGESTQLLSAIDPGGDAVFAWSAGDDIYALVRRRDGSTVPPHQLNRAGEPYVAADPTVAIDGAGRAVVAWKAQNAPREQLVASEIRVAVASRRGRFAPSRRISGTGLHANSFPTVAVNAGGQAAVAWTRYDSNDKPTLVIVARGRLGR
jgi:hypothetical protein